MLSVNFQVNIWSSEVNIYVVFLLRFHFSVAFVYLTASTVSSQTSVIHLCRNEVLLKTASDLNPMYS